jgi:murein L,D-transpeptidase YcbB/YkuD
MTLMKDHFLFTALLTMLISCCGQVLLPLPSLAAQPALEQVAELLRQQIEEWKTPPLVEPLPPTRVDAVSISPTNPEAAPVSPAPDTTTTPQSAPITAPTTPPENTVKAPPPPKPKLRAGKDILRTAVMLVRFYENRAYRPAWTQDTEALLQAETLLETIQQSAEREGLRAGDYRLAKLGKLLEDVRAKSATTPALDPRTVADLDLLLTDAFFLYGAHVSAGKTNLDAMEAQWFEKRQKTDLVQVLEKALDSRHLDDTLQALPPRHPGYVSLRDALARYRDLAATGGWPRVPAGFDMRPGDHDERIPALRARLEISGELKAQAAPETDAAEEQPNGKKARKKRRSGNEEYDGTLEQAVKTFQHRHGLEPDGVIGGGTLAALNISVEARIRQIMANMERWRELPATLEERRVEVNIPNFTLDVVENDQAAMHMKVVVGKMVGKNNTPTFTAHMTHVVLNPYWHVPKSIAEKELFPLSRKNPQYFAKNKFVVRRVAVGEKQIPDPNATDGSLISTKVYQYLLKQAPGPKNALGRVKFIFPNPHGVYLHDTPSKDLFNRTVRTYSHGCIRVERPLDLAEHLLRDTAKWSRGSILATIDRQKEKTVWLPEAISVHIQYWTAWVDADGIVQFRNDIYGYDKVPEVRLPTSTPKKPRPAPAPAAPPLLQEAQSIPPLPSEPQPTLQSDSPPQAPASSPPESPTEVQRTL